MSETIPVFKGFAIAGYALVDSEDYEWLSEYKWRIHPAGYAMVAGGGQRRYMHRMILGLSPGDGLQADHINRNPLDNRSLNLRVVTHGQNQQNRAPKEASSIYRGVSRRGSRWVAQVQANGKNHFFGYWDNEFDAAMAAYRGRVQLLPYAYDHDPRDLAIL